MYKEQPGGIIPPPEGEQTFAIDDIVVYTPLVSNDSLWASSPQDGRLPLDYAVGSNVSDVVPPAAPSGLMVL
jgi:hypothetical protein